MPAAIEIPTTLAHARGAYTATAHFGGQSIFGLPLFAGRYAVFDRGRAGSTGVVRLASSRG